MDRNLALELARVTEAAALAAARLMGRGDPVAIDEAATAAMRNKSFRYLENELVPRSRLGEEARSCSRVSGQNVQGVSRGDTFVTKSADSHAVFSH